MLDVIQRTGSRKHQSNVDHSVIDTDTPMRPAAEEDVVFWVLVRGTVGVKPSIWVQGFRRGEDLRIMHRVEERRDDHAAGGDGVVGRDWERFRCDIWDLTKRKIIDRHL